MKKKLKKTVKVNEKANDDGNKVQLQLGSTLKCNKQVVDAETYFTQEIESCDEQIKRI